ncbi:uncharacterized protein ARMOST_12203 [Armillaria ostoyae]|uniref:Uncharacterized protein n=1 Tax=Armillaria ostoyae TaxID=47428 RepID=A0A284RJB7_ARMOS|nr:uncharacterized protein ARMOST_12203 [Armillaria ostoyae]
MASGCGSATGQPTKATRYIQFKSCFSIDIARADRSRLPPRPRPFDALQDPPSSHFSFRRPSQDNDAPSIDSLPSRATDVPLPSRFFWSFLSTLRFCLGSLYICPPRLTVIPP